MVTRRGQYLDWGACGCVEFGHRPVSDVGYPDVGAVVGDGVGLVELVAGSG